MGLLNNIGRGAVGWSTGGLSELGRKDPFGMGGGGSGPSGPMYTPPITAQNVKIPADLTAALGGIGTAAYNNIGSNYGVAKKKLAGDASTLGMNPNVTGPNSYAASRLGTGQNLDTGNLASVLGSGLGETGYQDTLSQRDFSQKNQLAEEIARLNKPDLLQQILGGVGQVGGTAAQIYGAYGKNAKSPYTQSASYQPPSYYDYG